MFEVEIDRSFSAAHRLCGYNGNCSRLHGHNYKVTVVVRSDTQDEVGIAVDFRRLKNELDVLLEHFDHSNLSDLPEFSEINPTSENIAKLIYRKISVKINNGTARVYKVRIGESEHSAVTYFEE